MIVKGELRTIKSVFAGFPRLRYENGVLMNTFYDFNSIAGKQKSLIMLVGDRTTCVGRGTAFFGVPFFQVITTFGVFYVQEANLLALTNVL